MSDSDTSIPALGEVVEFPDRQHPDDSQWIVLYEDDYENHIVDVDGNVGVLVGQDQAGEVLRLAANVIATLSHRDADGDDVIRDMIDELEEVLDE